MTATPARRCFDYLPVGLFAAVMGMAGLSIAWRLAAKTFGVSSLVGDGLSIAALACLVVLAFAYFAKTVTAFDAVRAEFVHPVNGNLFGTIFISILLVPVMIAPAVPFLAEAIWCVGAAAMLGFSWLTIDRWMSDRQQVEHATPAWIVPVVGLLNVPLAVPLLHLPQVHGLAVACLAIGLFFAIPLFTLIFSRLLFEAPLAEPLQPMLLILIAPFAVGFSAYVATFGQVDRFAQSLFAIMLFLLTVLIGRLRRLVQCCPFRVAWWAVGFPLAASAGAAVRYAGGRPSPAAQIVAWTLLGMATLVIASLFVRTLVGILRGELRALR